ncbi:hypothetical protein Tco_0899813 [Tanacetum coccineum]
MDTRSSAGLKKAIESLEAKKKAMAEKMKAMKDQIFELSVNRQGEDDNDIDGSGVRLKGPGQWHSNDIKVEIPEYDGKLDPDEFVECQYVYEARAYGKAEGEGLDQNEAVDETKIPTFLPYPDEFFSTAPSQVKPTTSRGVFSGIRVSTYEV